MHRHHALRRQIEIERGEDRLLHLAGIRGVADQDDLPGEVDGDMVSVRVPYGVTSNVKRHADDAPAAPLERYWSALSPTFPPRIPLRPALPRSRSYITIDQSRGCEQIAPDSRHRLTAAKQNATLSTLTVYK
jgi:hypothetical protein